MEDPNWYGDPAAMPAWNKAKNRPVRDDIPYGSSGRTLAQRRESSAAGLQRQREREQEEYEQQQALPTLEDKVQAIGSALTDLLATVRRWLLMGEPMDPAKITDIASELQRTMDKETRD